MLKRMWRHWRLRHVQREIEVAGAILDIVGTAAKRSDHPCTCGPRADATPWATECPRVEECYEAWLDRRQEWLG